VPLIGDATALYLGDVPVQKVYAGTELVWPTAVPPPQLSSLAPTSMTHLSGAVTLTATGTGFTPGSLLQIKASGGAWVTTTSSAIVNATTATGTIDMSPGSYSVSVVDSGGQRSNELPFSGLHDTPTLTSISPAAIFYEDPPQRLSVVGTKFYQGMTIYLLPPGGSWQGKAAVIQSATQAYCDGVDLPVGTTKVMVGYDGVNVTRSGQLNLSVTNDVPVITSVTPATIGRGVAFDMVITGRKLGTTQMVTMGVHDFEGLGYWPDQVSDTEVRLNDFFFSVVGSQTGAYDIACRANENFGPILASKVDALTVTD
jgi:hypothetical protein